MSSDSATTPPTARPSAAKALTMTLCTLPLIGGYVGLSVALGVHEIYTGFLFLLCWGGFGQARLAQLPHAALGSTLGLALGFALHLMLNSGLGANAGYLFGALVLPVIFCQIMGRLSVLVNFSTMTFLATITIQHIQMHGDFRSMFIALLFGIVYFGVVLGAIERLTARHQPGATGSTGAAS